MTPPLTTDLCRLVGVEHPVVQTGMGWVSDARLTAATANAGGLGIVASATLSYDELAHAIADVRALTDRPFGVNLRADAPDADRRVELLIEQGVRVASFALAPRREQIARLKDAGVIVIPSVGARRHAEKVADWGADAVIVQGGEGGGHTGGVATTVLLPQVVDAVEIPVIAAGGFHDGRGLAAALAFGAAGVAMGTRFLLTSDSPVGAAVKQLYLDGHGDATIVSDRFDGVPHRVLRTERTEAMSQAPALLGLPRALRHAVQLRRLTGASWRTMLRQARALRSATGLGWGQVAMAASTPMLLRASMVEGRPEAGVMSSGQVVALIDDLPSCQELVDRVVVEAAATIAGLAQITDAQP